jgi:hypothetical protein
MPIKWKKSGNRFNPGIILKKIDAIRTVTADGKVSFTGFELDYCLPALHSMLDFPTAAAAEADISTLVWSALAKIKKELTPETFLKSINDELTSRLATREQNYYLLTSISLDSCDLPKELEINGTEIKFLQGDYPAEFSSRNELIRKHRVPVPTSPISYCYVLIKAKAKSHTSAVNKSLRDLDLIRAIWCSMGNPRLQLAFGNSTTSPINVIRLGGTHTLHHADGTPAIDAVWFEPNFKEASIFRMGDSEIVKYSLKALSKLATSAYKEKLISSLIRYVRALDESDPNTAFVRLWGALEMLVVPAQADYAKLVQRCAFLFNDTEFHRQLLEHLREYRNTNVHAGEESEKARTHCYQLQLYFVALLRFHLGNAKFFQSLDEANSFLEFPPDEKELKRHSQLINKAIRYRKPQTE